MLLRTEFHDEQSSSYTEVRENKEESEQFQHNSVDHTDKESERIKHTQMGKGTVQSYQQTKGSQYAVGSGKNGLVVEEEKVEEQHGETRPVDVVPGVREISC